MIDSPYGIVRAPVNFVYGELIMLKQLALADFSGGIHLLT